MKHLRIAALLGAITFLGIAPTTWAQTAEQLSPAEKAPAKTRMIKIKNLPSLLIAYWLDPANNPRPVALGDMNVNQFGAPRTAEDKGAFDLPGDIERIISIDAQNVLLVSGGDNEDITRLQELIEVLDQPLRQVELEAQFVEMTTAELSQFGLDATNPRETGLVPGNFTVNLNKLIGDGKAKVTSAPRVVAINNMTATMDAMNSPTNGTPPAWIYDFTLTINGDATITLLLQGKNKPAEGQENRTIIVNIRDGDTTALILGTVPQTVNNANPARTSVVFLTSRIVRRTSDKVSVAGE